MTFNARLCGNRKFGNFLKYECGSVEHKEVGSVATLVSPRWGLHPPKAGRYIGGYFICKKQCFVRIAEGPSNEL